MLSRKPDKNACFETSAFTPTTYLKAKVLYMCSSFWQLGVESRDFSQAEKERTACKDEKFTN